MHCLCTPLQDSEPEAEPSGSSEDACGDDDDDEEEEEIGQEQEAEGTIEAGGVCLLRTGVCQHISTQQVPNGSFPAVYFLLQDPS